MTLALNKENSFSAEEATPLMAQYLAIKARHPDCIVFFRLGDFYEMFFEDAVKASKALDIALTRRGQYQGKDIPMCGVPFHSYENYLARLIKQGYHVAICEQTEDPAEAKKRGYKSVVNREVVRIVTPGTVTEENLLNSRDANYLACIACVGEELAVAWLDLAAAEPYSQKVGKEELNSVLARINPSEILVPQKLVQNPDFFETFAPWRDQLTPQVDSRFDSENARKRLQQTYQVKEIEAFGDFSRAETAALGTLIDYASLTQKNDLRHLDRPRRIGESGILAIDPATRRNLELTQTLDGEREGSFLAAIDRTMTSAGARLLAMRISSPLTDTNEINNRLDAVEFLFSKDDLRASIRKELHKVPDLERALARISLGRGSPRDLAALREALKCTAQVKKHLFAVKQELPKSLVRTVFDNLGEYAQIIDKLERALAETLPILARDGGFIAKGYSPQLDELIELRDNSRRLIAGLQKKYENASGASNLKIRHNNVIGYYIEATPTQADKLFAQKDLFIHRQTLASAVRFTTVELGELERRINESAAKALAVELQLFDDFVKEITAMLADLRRTTSALAEIDFAAGMAELAREQNYCRPTVDDSAAFEIHKGRHPVVEQALRKNSTAQFVPNDCNLSSEKKVWLLTGPNMAGKSTFLRQNALIVIMAQIGSFVPAERAHIGVVDKLFSRVGASDDLARGRSTFMVEMVETAAILNQAGERSFVILDEIGRGTATYDGLSIAWAVLEHLCNVNKCRALFATHYHELTRLSSRLSSLYCATMRIEEWKNEIIFLHEVIPGVADRSYGIHVAKMAGLPEAVTERANEVLEKLENGNERKNIDSLVDELPLFNVAPVQRKYSRTNEKLEKIIEEIQPDEMTPKQALEKIYEIKKVWKES